MFSNYFKFTKGLGVLYGTQFIKYNKYKFNIFENTRIKVLNTTPFANGNTNLLLCCQLWGIC
jgi:hypothetical protein